MLQVAGRGYAGLLRTPLPQRWGHRRQSGLREPGLAIAELRQVQRNVQGARDRFTSGRSRTWTARRRGRAMPLSSGRMPSNPATVLCLPSFRLPPLPHGAAFGTYSPKRSPVTVLGFTCKPATVAGLKRCKSTVLAPVLEGGGDPKSRGPFGRGEGRCNLTGAGNL